MSTTVLRRGFVASFMAILILGITSVLPATASGSTASGTMWAAKLSPGQAQTLRDAVSRNPHLTSTQAENLVRLGHSQIVTMGYGQADGICGIVELWGWSGGYYVLQLSWDTYAVGTPEYGSAAVYTNGWVTTTDYHGLGGSPNEAFEGTIHYFNASETQSEGWSITTSEYLCAFVVTAVW